jgi:hypothetical protein
MHRVPQGEQTGFGVRGTSKPPFVYLVCLNLASRGKYRLRRVSDWGVAFGVGSWSN